MSYRPPSCDLLKPSEDKPVLKDCPFCGLASAEFHKDGTWIECRNQDCSAEGPCLDRDGHKWNSIPRRSEVAELLRLVDNADKSRHEIGIHLHTFEVLVDYADNLRKEWKL